MTSRVWAAAGLYFLAVFGLGFILGTIRVLVLLPHVGETVAVLLELPVILGFSWWICGIITRHLDIPPLLIVRIAMGAIALVVLLCVEIAMSMLVFERDVAGIITHYKSLPGASGLLGQFVYGAIPALQKMLEKQRVS